VCAKAEAPKRTVSVVASAAEAALVAVAPPVTARCARLHFTWPLRKRCGPITEENGKLLSEDSDETTAGTARELQAAAITTHGLPCPT
jgi:hypothetical protein